MNYYSENILFNIMNNYVVINKENRFVNILNKKTIAILNICYIVVMIATIYVSNEDPKYDNDMKPFILLICFIFCYIIKRILRTTLLSAISLLFDW